MRIDVLTIFPGMFPPVLDESILSRAQEAGVVKIAVHNLRPFTTDRHHTTDDAPFGGGVGMVMKPEPFFRAVESLRCPPEEACDEEIVLMSPAGERLDQAKARELAARRHLILLCGRYEGVDERVRDHLATMSLSVGDYVLTGGELPAMIVIDAVTRLLPGALGAEEGAITDSFEDGLLEYPQYTRPPEFHGLGVPDVLVSGNHAEVIKWRRQQSLRRTLQRRPDLLDKANLSQQDREFLEDQ